MNGEVSDAVLTEARGKVLLITLNRPRVRNAIDNSVFLGLTRAVQSLDNDPTLSVGVLTGAGPTFCSGMDLKAFEEEGRPVGYEAFIRGWSAETAHRRSRRTLSSRRPRVGALL